MSRQNLLPRLVFALTFFVLIISVALNWAMFKQGEKYYHELNETRLDPLGLNAFPPKLEPSLAGSSKPIVVFFGDSRAAQWPTPPSLDQFKFVNRGIGAQTAVQVLNRFDAHIVPLHPSIIVVQVGINDLKVIPIFPERKAAIIAECKNNIHQLVAQAIDDGETVILTTIFPTGNVPLERMPFWSSDVERAVVEVNDDIRLLQSPKVVMLDAYAILSEQGKLKTAYAQDEIHLNPAGYDALNRALVKILLSLD